MSLSTRLIAFGCTILFTMTLVHAQNPPVAPANYDEEKVPPFVLTDPLKTTDGRIVDSPELWHEVRRPELLRLFADEMYGQPLALKSHRQATLRGLGQPRPHPFAGLFTTANVLDGELVLEGKAIMYRIQLGFESPFAPTIGSNASDAPRDIDVHHVNVLVYTPKTDDPEKRFPAFIGLNFRGNHTVAADSSIPLGTIWRNGQPEPGKEEDRGSMSRRWPIEMIIDRGYAVVTAHYEDFEPDFDGGFRHGVRRFIYSENETPAPEDANAIATWAWGLSRILDMMASVQPVPLGIDRDRIAVIGHSRLGKAALWAAAQDTGFAMAISNNSGCGGAALSRREFGETVHRINTSFPHWFNDNFKKYNHDVNALPFDQHELIALIAPRPVYIASAVEDLWADPKGEFFSALHADPVYRLLGTDGFAGVTEMPELNKSVGGTIGYHIRSGGHDITEFDWEQFLNFADRHFKAFAEK